MGRCSYMQGGSSHLSQPRLENPQTCQGICLHMVGSESHEADNQD